MTNREFFVAIASNSTLSADLVEFAQNAIVKLDNRNAARSAKPTKAQIENETFKQSIRAYLETVGKAFASEIAVALDLSTAKVSALCSQMETSGEIISTIEKNAKKNKAKCYAISNSETSD